MSGWNSDVKRRYSAALLGRVEEVLTLCDRADLDEIVVTEPGPEELPPNHSGGVRVEVAHLRHMLVVDVVEDGPFTVSIGLIDGTDLVPLTRTEEIHEVELSLRMLRGKGSA